MRCQDAKMYSGTRVELCVEVFDILTLTRDFSIPVGCRLVPMFRGISGDKWSIATPYTSRLSNCCILAGRLIYFVSSARLLSFESFCPYF